MEQTKTMKSYTPSEIGRRFLRRIPYGWIVVYAIMILLVIFMALPLIYMVSTAFKPTDELFLFPPTFLVQKPTIRNFTELFKSVGYGEIPITRYIFNSLITTVTNVTATVFIACMAAYSLEKLRMPGYKLLYRVVVIGLMFVPAVAQIPTYIVMSQTEMLNTYWALIIPSMAKPMYLFLVKQFMSQFPDSILESARIDGAGEFKLFSRVVMPIIKPAWATVVVFAFIENWNNSGSSMIYITNQTMKTLPYALGSIGNGAVGAMGMVSAASLLATAPTIIVYLLMQRQVMNTMAHAGIKG